MFEKLDNIKNHLKAKYVEREDVIDAIFVSIVAGQHCLLIGPPGTAKSALVSDVAKMIDGWSYFQWLLTRFTTPEELFGPVSLKELENGVYKRNTAHKLPEANLTFLDEVFKANSAILNALLTLINERLFYNNGTPIKTPLNTVIGASNEYPEEQEGLEALFDRFLLRYELEYVGEDANFLSMLKNVGSSKTPDKLTVAEIDELQFLADMVVIPDEVLQTLLTIRTELKDEGIRPSDRRFRQALSLIRANATLDQRPTAKLSDIMILRDGLWETVDQKSKVHEIVDEHAADKLLLRLEEIQQMGKEVFNNAKKQESSEAGLEANAKLKELIVELNQLEEKNPSRTDEINPVQNKITKAQKQIGEVILGL
ncbi:AAA family ATPase [Cytobacillus sp. IB215665]|uniref:AAA family ATPase n=1 Tax=Cytobacillus sp. IB215665 TaxID=3097357 RepID=UPI002A0CDBD7|nr:AAA family ATPase [Cytobacillus sp. IB215665]MDX8367688.1 AAA family ATPase [Cytobacillus sp. IB215665]